MAMHKPVRFPEHQSPRDAVVLAYDHVVCGFGSGAPVLNDVSFALRAGDVAALIGRNGAGKTTLIHLALGLLTPERGEVRAFGLSPRHHPVEVKRRVGYVGEAPELPPFMTLPELLELHRRLFPTWDAQFEKQLLERFGLAGNTNRLMRLSKGQRQQALLLCAVCHRPELLLLDEPASGLDPAVRREFLETSIQLLNREGSTILFSSHHMGDVERLGGRVLLLDRGAIRLDSEVDTLREAHCLAVIPASLVADDAVLRRLDGCRSVRRVQGTWHAVYAGTPEEIDGRLRAMLKSDTIQCTALPLEELFIELVGERPGAEAAA